VNLANCPRCGKIFAPTIRNLCPACIKLSDQECDRCNKFLKENRTATIEELSKETGVQTIQIVQFIREGRISIAKNPNIKFSCETCGASIREGNLCTACRNRLFNSFKEVKSMTEQSSANDPKVSTYNINRERKDRI
jgi:flagellar operon protein (TIGR03826 family)